MNSAKSGFSLIEAVITFVLIAIISVVALSFFVYCTRMAIQNDARMVAANFARSTMEGLYKLDYNDARLNPQIDTSQALPVGSVLSRYPTTPSRTYTITDAGDYKLITVKVTWNQ